jgi:endoglucanase Acf2
MHIHGIQWLPITPASQYLQTLPNFPLRKAEVVRAHPSPATHEWGDLYAAVLSYSDPSEALTLLPLAVKNQAIKSSALLYQTVYQNLELVR